MIVRDNKQLFNVNEFIDSRYQIIEFLDRPDKGFLYKALDTATRQLVNVRILKIQGSLTEKSKDKFEQRIESLKSLVHPSIIRTRGYGILANDILYVVSDYEEGTTLANLLNNRCRLDFEEAFPIFKNICQALAHSHATKAAHGAICPENILLVNDKQNGQLAKLYNFRITQFARPRANEKTTPEFGEIFADPTYMSPEQCQGLQANGSSDIYSLGCVMYRTLSGITSLAGKSGTEALLLHVCNQPKRLSKLVPLPDYLETLVMKTIEKEPCLRYHSADELLKALEFVQDFFNSKICLSTLSMPQKWKKQLELWIKELSAKKFIGETLEMPHSRNFSGFCLDE